MSRLLTAAIFLILCLGAFGDSALKPGQHIRLVCVQDPRLNVTRTIGDDGFMDVPVVGRVGVAGQNLDVVRQALDERLFAFGSLATVQLWMTADPHAALAFGGAVRYPGVAPFRAGLTLAALLAEIGPTDTADLHRVHITDALGKDLLVDAAAPGDILLRPGDTITVPVGVGSDQVTVLGGVNKAGTMPFHDGLTVADALAASGGLSAHADATKISIQRNGDSMPATSETVLLRGDVLRIGVSVDLEYVSVKGAVVNPGVVEWRKGMRLSDAITAAGGPKDRANLTRVELLPFGSTKRVRYDLLAIRSGAKPDPEIQPNDTIVVPVGRGHG